MECTESAGKRVDLLVTCLVDLIRPAVGFAASLQNPLRIGDHSFLG